MRRPSECRPPRSRCSRQTSCGGSSGSGVRRCSCRIRTVRMVLMAYRFTHVRSCPVECPDRKQSVLTHAALLLQAAVFSSVGAHPYSGVPAWNIYGFPLYFTAHRDLNVVVRSSQSNLRLQDDND
ncbi:hypothetical protein BRADI_1g49316v3 [Brachypodium distachyon]|uniref:Uncharacterized protein n=1 Tax=Brachypodium distachyon TaxID=15368 RepID=A0A2K2DQJ4_BRADI|nr:hypothetical protein BRADI_1g49316v3 [Brachypodium distachyon]